MTWLILSISICFIFGCAIEAVDAWRTYKKYKWKIGLLFMVMFALLALLQTVLFLAFLFI